MDFSTIVSKVNSFIWGPIMLFFLVGTGIYLMFLLRFMPLRNLGYAIKSVFSKRSRKKTSSSDGDITPFQSLMTALAATIGTGNIAGVATAMFLGGAGAVFWMWFAAIFGLATKYSEAVLSVHFRVKTHRGNYAGGPMYALKYGLKNKTIGSILAILFAFFAVIASFGIGNMTQSNTVALAVNNTFHIPTWITGIVLASFALLVIVGGIKSIGRVTEKLVPFMAFLYILGGLICIFANITEIPAGLKLIIGQAFSFDAVGGGVGGIVIAHAMRYGIARGVFSNEAGLGSAPIAAAAAKTDHPCRQGYVSMTGTFFDTILVCSITGLVIASSGLLSPGNTLTGVDLTIASFNNTLGVFGSYIVTLGTILFAFSTVLGWSYYGEKSLEFFFYTDNKKQIEKQNFKEKSFEVSSTKKITLILGWILLALGVIFVTHSILQMLSTGALTEGILPGLDTALGKRFYLFFVLLLIGAICLGIGYKREQGIANMIYRIIFCFFVFIGATTKLTLVWDIADTMNGLMAIPNLLSLLLLSGVIYKQTMDYELNVLKPERALIKK
jgi:AGCS family alanine or glycine:cation symporter